ncbi:Lariat debranching enzyme [Hyphodiscus hymeniophilus]|uniref:Lariat debranching enzyme n=1 Tax=Hyphodiscus hymeniophilus TaxID=353542 RepID=A0A9P6SND2_9HELO|nr:Lariat debranching enzyme [Hyphodiscus hymeniophilus]
MDPALQESAGLRIAVEGCGHGTLDAIYASVTTAAQARGWDGVDLLIIGGDFQVCLILQSMNKLADALEAVRNASDLTVMSCPVKYRAIGDFHAYYSGITKAPYLTIFVGGNHEASSHLWELYYGGWVAPNIYYMGAANVLRIGGVRIAGMSGIWKGYNYNKPHYERLPYNQDDIKSIYHVREIDTRKLLQLRTQVDVGISHDWPRAVEKHGNEKALYRLKPDFEQESRDGTLGNLAATYVMDRLRPPYWFAAHMHCKFSATKTYDETSEPQEAPEPDSVEKSRYSIENSNGPVDASLDVPTVSHNADEIDLDMDDEEMPVAQTEPTNTSSANKNEISLDDEPVNIAPPAESSVPSDIRDQLPAAFQRPPQWSTRRRQTQPGQPAPSEVTNKTVRFLALDKCLPGRKFLQLLEIQPSIPKVPLPGANTIRPKPKFEYDPEWLAITRVFAPDIVLGNKNARLSQDLGEDSYRAMVEKEQEWIEEHITQKGRLEIPETFEITAPPFYAGMPEIINEGPKEYNNPQMQQFCDLLGIENKFFATEEEREQRIINGPALAEGRFGGSGRGRGGRGERGGQRGRGGARGGGRARGPRRW